MTKLKDKEQIAKNANCVQKDKCEAAFEAWHKEAHWELTHSHHYNDFRVKGLFEAYKAAYDSRQAEVDELREALEFCLELSEPLRAHGTTARIKQALERGEG